MTELDPLLLDGSPLSPAEVHDVAHRRRRAVLAPQARDAVLAGRRLLERSLAAGHAIYGVNTGFGSLARVRLEPAELEEVQANLLRSHASGVGPPLESELVRGMMLLLAASLSRGHSGVRRALPVLAGVPPGVV